MNVEAEAVTLVPCILGRKEMDEEEEHVSEEMDAFQYSSKLKLQQLANRPSDSSIPSLKPLNYLQKYTGIRPGTKCMYNLDLYSYEKVVVINAWAINSTPTGKK